jgi:double-stranded uracil-DNA glycosylase
VTGLEPILDKDTRILILGTFPGEASLLAGQYYAHRRNQFWQLISTILGVELVTLSYPERIARLLANRIGLWDVLSACDRKGSLDSAIRDPKSTDFAPLRQRCPSLERVCFNGKAAGKAAPQFERANFKTLVLPSSSPANAGWSLDRKLAAWRAIFL